MSFISHLNNFNVAVDRQVLKYRSPIMAPEHQPVLKHALKTPGIERLRGKRVVLASNSPRRKEILRTYVRATKIPRQSEFISRRIGIRESTQKSYPQRLTKHSRIALSKMCMSTPSLLQHIKRSKCTLGWWYVLSRFCDANIRNSHQETNEGTKPRRRS